MKEGGWGRRKRSTQNEERREEGKSMATNGYDNKRICSETEFSAFRFLILYTQLLY